MKITICMKYILKELNNFITSGKKYFALATDVEIRETHILASGSAICLNGHKLKIAKGAQILNINDGSHIAITNCQHNERGYITRATDSEVGIANKKDEMIKLTDGEISFYNVRIASINIANDIYAQKFIEARNNSKVYFENATISNVRYENEGTKAFIDIEVDSDRTIIDRIDINNNKTEKADLIKVKGNTKLIINKIRVSTNSIGKAVELNNTEDTTADFDPDDIAKNKVYAVLAYFTILVLIPIFIAKDSKYARYHANQGLVLLLFEIVGSILVGVVAAISSTLGSVCSGLLGLVTFVLLIIGIINAVDGRAKELPVIGNIRILNLD